MKNKQKFPVSEEDLLNQIERLDKEVDRRFLELRAKKKIAKNPLIQKNINFLQNYNNLFGKTSQHTGDADTCFRKSLRSYTDSLNIIKELHLETSPLLKKKKAKQRSILTQHHSEGYKPSLLNLEQLQQQNTTVKELYSKTAEQQFGSGSDSEERDYFSPLADFTPDESASKTKEPIESDRQKQLFERRPISSSSEENLVSAREALESIYRMAEEFATENLDAEENEQANATDTEPPEANETDLTDTERGEEADQEDEELQEMEKMIKQASEELDKVAEENQQLMDSMQEGEEQEAAEELSLEKSQAGAGEDSGDGGVFKFNPAIDAAILKELEDAEKQAIATAKVIVDLKSRVGELLQKETMTEAEAKELEEKNKALKTQMILFEEKTKRIQFLLAQTNLFDQMKPLQPPLQMKHAEDILPKMLVCGVPDNFMPKIVLCYDKGSKSCRSRSSSRGPTEESRNLSPITRKLNESYNMQERLVNENANLEGTRYKLQSDLINKDQTVECLQRQLCSLQNEMRMVCQENAKLNEKLQTCPNPSCPKNSRSSSPAPGGGGGGGGGRMSCGPGRGLCPADVENRLQEYSNTTSQLEKQLVDVEQEVKNIQQELFEVQKEREHLEHHRKMLALSPPCPGARPCPPMPCPPYPCMPPPCGHPPCPPAPCSRPPLPCCPPEASGEDQHYKELKEKYNRLQEDFKAKLTEVAGLRAENEKLKELAEKAEDSRYKLELKVKELEKRLKDLRGDGDKGVGSKEQLIELQQQLKVHKELYRQAQDELEELRALVEDIQGQLNDYRNKYLEAIQTVEEQRRQIEIMRMENNRISEQVNLEILRVKNQFQEKLQELAPLPDILKATQLKLQEAQQMHLLAERNNEALARELQTYKDKLQEIMDEMALADSDKAAGAGQKETLMEKIKELEKMLQESKNENDDLRMETDRLKEIADENERIANEKLHEIAQLEAQLESVREESARQVARIKDRCEIVRKSTQNQVNDLERQLAQTKAAAKAAEKDRDDIRQKMQAQIRNLNENFEDAQMRIRNLQGHVNFLKNSYCPPTELGASEKKPVSKVEPCCCAAEY